MLYTTVHVIPTLRAIRSMSSPKSVRTILGCCFCEAALWISSLAGVSSHEMLTDNSLVVRNRALARSQTWTWTWTFKIEKGKQNKVPSNIHHPERNSYIIVETLYNNVIYRLSQNLFLNPYARKVEHVFSRSTPYWTPRHLSPQKELFSLTFRWFPSSNPPCWLLAEVIATRGGWELSHCWSFPQGPLFDFERNPMTHVFLL